MMSSDSDAWNAFPQHRRWFDKLDFSLRMGYECGPNGVPPRHDGEYIVRPIYNLLGMGAGARFAQIVAGDDSSVPPGYFWCERFVGPHLSVTYRWDAGWKHFSSWEGTLHPGSLTRFTMWRRSDMCIPAPDICDVLSDVGVLNIEFVGERPVEVHLRASPDPQDGSAIIPVWADQAAPDLMRPSFDDAAGFIDVPRVGFIVLP